MRIKLTSRKITFLMLCVFALFLAPITYAQDCYQKLEEAELMYQNGQFTELIILVKACENSEDKSEQWKANRLLALAYLGNNENDLARLAARNMMKLNPTYQPSSLRDPSELVKLLESIPIIPKLSLGLALSLGTNSTLPKITDVYMVANQTKKYTGLNSYQLAVSSSYQFNKSFGFDLSVMVSSKKYSIDYSFDNWKLNMDEKLTYLNLPLSFKYIPKHNFAIKPYIQLGGYVGYLVFAKNNFEAEYVPGSEIYSDVNLSSLDRRNKVDAGLIGTLGLNYPIGEGQLFLQASYFNSLRNAVDESQRYANKQLLYNYYYLDDDIKLNNIAIGIGYNFYINYKVLED